MSLKTHSKFYYGFEVTDLALYLDFDEGGAELTAELEVYSYTLEGIAAEFSRAMNAVGGQEYTVTVDRATRKLTIAAPGAFSLRIASGSHIGATAFGLGGFTGADVGPDTSFEGGAAGSVYSTQFILQSYVSSEHSRGAVYGTVNKSADGKVEVVKFGDERFMECEIKYVTDIDSGTGGPIRTNANGVLALNDFMQYLTTKGAIEFMADESLPDSFETFFLESTRDDNRGLKYQLREMYGRGLPGYFETGLLKFRVIE